MKKLRSADTEFVHSPNYTLQNQASPLPKSYVTESGKGPLAAIIVIACKWLQGARV